jgi:DNA-directed RNA polymerase specialized sigma24 family protein
MSKVVQNRLRNIVEKYNSDKRRLNTESISLDEPLNSKEDTEPLVEEIPDKEDSIQAELKIDIVSVCQKLTPRQQILCDLLRSSFNIREISSELGVNRKRVYEEIHRIRTIFEDEGLKNYLL